MSAIENTSSFMFGAWKDWNEIFCMLMPTRFGRFCNKPSQQILVT